MVPKCKPQLSLFVKLGRHRRICRTCHVVYKIPVMLGSAIIPGTKEESIFQLWNFISKAQNPCILTPISLCLVSCPITIKGTPILGCWQVLSPTYFPMYLFDGENISFDASLVIYSTNSTNIPIIMIINRIYEHQNLLSL